MLKTLALQDYIKTITSISLNERKTIVKLNEVAKKLTVSNAAVSDMIKKLVKDKLVINHAYKGIELTLAGLTMGKRLIRHHRLWEVFLHQFLGMSWDAVHDEAENLEHAASDALINRIDKFMNFPTTDPHGNPIPTKEGTITYRKEEVSMLNTKINSTYKVSRFVSFDSDYLTFISNHGIKIGSDIKIKQKLNSDDTVVCIVNQKEINISKTSAEKIFVCPTNN